MTQETVLLSKTLQNEQQKCLTVDPSLFDKMKTSQGITVSEINKQGLKVLIFFTASVGCIHCRGTIHDIYDLKDELLKMNCVPLIAHEEDYKTYDKFLNSSEITKKFSSMLHIERKSFVKYFKLQHFEIFSETYNFLMRGLSEISRISKLGYTNEMEYYVPGTEQILAAVFVVENQKIISEYRKEHKFQRFDIARILIDTDGNGIEVHTSIFECDIPKKKLSKKSSFTNGIISLTESIMSPKKETSNVVSPTPPAQKEQSSIFSFFSKKSDVVKEEFLKLSEVLNDKNNLKYFKLFATSEYSVENVLFYEEIQNYKKLKEDKRNDRAAKLMDFFFQEDSIYEINISKKFITEIEENISKGNCSVDLFDKALIDVVNSNLSDTYQRFKFSEVYQEMIQKTKKKYFLYQ
eukprot:gene2736-4145_t